MIQPCKKCGRNIPQGRIDNARRVGTVPDYCDSRCRNAAKQERHRSKVPVTQQELIHLRNLAAHGMIAEKLLHDPRVLDVASENIRRWRKRNGATPALQEWERLLNTGNLHAILHALLSVDEKGMRLRSSSPFAGVLNEIERGLVFQAARAHES
jgi:hypothetical protein